MQPQHDPATDLIIQATASSLRALANQLDETSGLLVPPGRRDWHGSSAAAFSRAVHGVHRQVMLAADLMANAAQSATYAAGAAGRR